MSQQRNYKHNTQLSTSAVIVIDPVPNGVVSVITQLLFTNTSTSTRTVTVHTVEASGSVAPTNKSVSRAVAPGTSWAPFEMVNTRLSAGMSLQALQDVGTDVNVLCSGIDF